MFIVADLSTFLVMQRDMFSILTRENSHLIAEWGVPFVLVLMLAALIGAVITLRWLEL